MMIAAALAMPEIPLPVFLPYGWCGNWSGSILTPYATGPSPIYYGSVVPANGGLLATGGDFWGLIFLVLLVITGLLWMPVVLL